MENISLNINKLITKCRLRDNSFPFCMNSSSSVFVLLPKENKQTINEMVYHHIVLKILDIIVIPLTNYISRNHTNDLNGLTAL